jgi:RNA polymerase primary sigma factor
MAGDRAAVDPFLAISAQPIWSTIVVLVGDGPEGHQTFNDFLDALKARGFARLSRFDGRSSLATFLKLDVRDWLAERTAGGFSTSADKAWRRFERLYAADIRRLVKRRFPKADATELEDHFQDICLKLVEDDYRRIRAYKGDHAFTGYILQVVNRLLIDLMRKDAPRLRLPEKINRMSALAKAVFAAGAWRGVSLEAQAMRLALLGQIDPDPSLEDVQHAIQLLIDDIQAARAASRRPRPVYLDGDDGAATQLRDETPGAEDQMLEAEEAQARDQLIQKVWREAQSLPPEERTFLDLILNAGEPLPARRIASLMGVTAEEVYRIRQRVQRWMSRLADDMPKTQGRSV